LTKIGVVYLCRFAEGEEPARRFLDSYRRHPAGIDHDLHIAFKGFPNREALDGLRASLGAHLAHTIELDDAGYDIGSYFAAANIVANPQLLFLNTFSEILGDDWLAHFDKALAMPGVGLAGATGSWQSIRSGYEAALLRLLRRPKYYFSRYLGAARSKDEGERRLGIGVLLDRVSRLGLYPFRVYQFGRHPNPHIRTNAFMIQRELFLSLRGTVFNKKMDAYRFESGRHSMTRQIAAHGLRPVVVDRWGRLYDIPEWKSSSTFWIGTQENLLIADNQTRNYASGSAQLRGTLKCYAWQSPKSWDLA
jgi:hypothetical protein